MKETQQDLGSLIREYRIKCNYTQQDLAKKLGYDSTQFISLFERGVSKIPLYILGQLIVFLKIPEKKVLETLMSNYAINIKNEIQSGKKAAKKN